VYRGKRHLEVCVVETTHQGLRSRAQLRAPKRGRRRTSRLRISRFESRASSGIPAVPKTPRAKLLRRFGSVSLGNDASGASNSLSAIGSALASPTASSAATAYNCSPRSLAVGAGSSIADLKAVLATALFNPHRVLIASFSDRTWQWAI